MKKFILTTLAAASMLTAMAQTAEAQNVAIVNGKPVPKARMDAFIQQASRSGQPVTPEVMNQIKEELIAREVFMQEAVKLGLDATDNYRSQVELARQSILIRELLTEYQKKNPVSDADIKAEYDRFAAEAGGKEYRASHILVEKEDEAKAIIAQLKKGGKFDAIAKKSSKDPGSGAKGGELDWASPRSYVKEFSEALTKLSKGHFTETPVKTQFGYHVIRLEDTRDAQLPPLDQIKPQISQKLQQAKIEAYRKELTAKAKVE